MLNRLKVISDISRDTAQVFFAFAVVGPLIGGMESLFVPIFGLIVSLVLWYASVVLIKD